MALFQPTNITPSDLNGTGTIDASEDMAVTWQVNGTGNTPMVAFKIDIMLNDTASTLLYSTGQVPLSEPFYGTDSLGNPEYFTATITAEALDAAGIVNDAEKVYKFLITQWWSAAESVLQSSASAFIARAKPVVSIENFEQTVASLRYTFEGAYSQAQGDPIEWARWQISSGAGNEILLDTGRVYNMGRLETTYDGFLSGNNYMVRLSGQTINAVEFDTGWQIFTAEYEQATLDGGAHACPRCDTDAVQVDFPYPLYTMGAGGGNWSIGGYAMKTKGPSSIVFIDDAIEANAVDVTVSITPYQNLNGYTGAWPAGASINKLPPHNSGAAGGNGVIVSAYTDGTVLVSGEATDDTTVAFFDYQSGVSFQEDMILTTGTPDYALAAGQTTTIVPTLSVTYETAGGETHTVQANDETGFTLTAGNKLINASKLIPTGWNVDFILRPRAYSNAHAGEPWVPYSNICTIYATNQINVRVTGKNMINTPQDSSFAIASELPPGTYTFSGKMHSSDGNNFTLQFKNGNEIKYDLSYIPDAGDFAITFTASDPFAFMAFPGTFYSPQHSGSYQYIQLEVGAEATEYAPYTGYGTGVHLRNGVYGGTYDLSTGVVTRTQQQTWMGSQNWTQIEGTTVYYTDISDKVPGIANFLSDTYTIIESDNPESMPEYTIMGDSESGRIYANDPRDSDIKLRGWIVYPMVTETTSNESTATFPLSAGINNVWGTASDVIVTYQAAGGGQNLTLPTGNDGVSWTRGDDTGLILTAPFSLAWKGYLFDLSGTVYPLSMVMGNGVLTVQATAESISVVAGAATLFSVNADIATDDEILIMLMPTGYSVTLNQGTIYEQVYTGNLSSWQDDITSITMYGPQTCEYLWIVNGAFTDEQMEETALNTPAYDGTTQFLASFDSGLGAGAIRSSEPLTGLIVYRQEEGENVIRKAAMLSIGTSAFRDYSAVNGKTYRYVLYGLTESGATTSAITSNSTSPLFWNWDLLLCSKDNNGNYHVQSEYRFALDVSSGTQTNNNKPTMQANFTRYPLRQPTTQNYRSSTLTAFVGKAKDGKYVDSLEKIEQLREISTSTLTKFLKTRKGEILMVETGDPISMSVSDKYQQQPVKVALPWVEVGDAKSANVLTSTYDEYWNLD